MLWNDRRASCRSSATICRSMLSICGNLVTLLQRIALECALGQRNHEWTNFEREVPTVSTQPAVAPSHAATEDFMPLHGIDHVELYVGNALQSAFFYVH